MRIERQRLFWVALNMPTPVDRLYEEAFAIIEVLGQSSDLSLQKVAAADQLHKALLLAAAKHF